MKIVRTNYLYVLPTFLFMLLAGCSKQDEWLDAKQQKRDVMPASLKDLQAVLDNEALFNQSFPVGALMGTDNVYLFDADVSAADLLYRDAYLWSADLYQGGYAPDWNTSYAIVENVNIVLEALDKLKEDAATQAQLNNIRGSALFYRALAFYNLAQLYCKPYSTETKNELGIPLRSSADVNVRSVRSTVQETYDKITSDLKLAAMLVPAATFTKTRPAVATVNALLAKTYFVMESYSLAKQYADLALGTTVSLLDYNTLNAALDKPFPTFTQGNPEIIFYAETWGASPVLPGANATANIAPSLYSSYEAGDLRKALLYAPKSTPEYYKFRASYTDLNVYDFAGIGTNELLLLRAECLARAGDKTAALSDLNALLQKRYTPASFQPWTSNNEDDIIRKIVLERRKELPYTGNLRWEDLRRLNKDARFAVTLTRQYMGKTYTLPPGNPRYVFPIPDDEIRGSGIQQNPR